MNREWMRHSRKRYFAVNEIILENPLECTYVSKHKTSSYKHVLSKG